MKYIINSRLIQRLAQAISLIGHPILLGSIAALYVNFTSFPKELAIKLSIQLLCLSVLPLVVFIAYKIFKGEFKDFDVSDQDKRNQLYYFLLVLLIIQCFFVFYHDFGWLIVSGALLVTCMIFSFIFINRYLKISLHTSFTFLLATMSLKVNPSLAIGLYMSALLIGFSRLVLKRHKIEEVMAGILAGLLFGFCFILIND